MQGRVFAPARLEGLAPTWHCRKFTPTTVTRNRRVIETAAEYPLSVSDLMDEVVAATIDNPARPPLLLRYWGRHYSAYIHSGQTLQLPDFEAEVDVSKVQALIVSTRSERDADSSLGLAKISSSLVTVAAADVGMETP